MACVSFGSVGNSPAKPTNVGAPDMEMPSLVKPRSRTALSARRNDPNSLAGIMIRVVPIVVEFGVTFDITMSMVSIEIECGVRFTISYALSLSSGLRLISVD